MRGRLAVIFAAVVLLGAAIGLWLSRPRPSAEQQIAATIVALGQAVETKNPGGILRHVSDDYDDGVNRKTDITRMAVGGLREPTPLRVHLEAPHIQVAGTGATAVVRSRFRVGESASLEDSVELAIRLEFAREGRRWKVVKATGWEPAADLVSGEPTGVGTGSGLE